MNSLQAIDELLHTCGGILRRRDHPELGAGFDSLLRQGRLTPVLPGVYTTPALVDDPRTRMRAVCQRHPDAILLREAAARASFWPEVRMGTIQVAVPGPVAPARGFAFTRRQIAADLVVDRVGLRYSSPALTAIDLATMECADAIDLALRLRVATLDGMYEALRLTPNRLGNRDRRRLLIDSRNEPWSAAERQAHRLLRQARMEGWKSNWPVFLAGQIFFIDIAFRHQMLAIEIDGRIHETKEDLFQSDRRRQNALILAGWRVLRFTWEMVRDHPEVIIATIRRALRY